MIDERLDHARLILKTEDGPLIITADDFDDMSEVTLHPGHPHFGNIAVWYEGGDYDCPCMEINEDGQEVRADYCAVVSLWNERASPTDSQRGIPPQFSMWPLLVAVVAHHKACESILVQLSMTTATSRR
jgi:hypothetical protein